MEQENNHHVGRCTRFVAWFNHVCMVRGLTLVLYKFDLQNTPKTLLIAHAHLRYPVTTIT